MDPPLFSLPIPSSRASVPTGYGYVLPDQNGWSRSLHFEAGWLLVFTGLYYVISGNLTRHFRDDLLPDKHDVTPRQLGYKSVKYLVRLDVVDSVRALGQGLGGSNPEIGYAWYAGI